MAISFTEIFKNDNRYELSLDLCEELRLFSKDEMIGFNTSKLLASNFKHFSTSSL